MVNEVKTEYERAEMEIIEIDADRDIICTSGGNPGDDETEIIGG